ncbi:MAG: hypothetical protein LBF15_00320 [Candidatus Peribacteria bacterium]|nr:hypothetical protein [Candidatus Peribacteria bacterium]
MRDLKPSPPAPLPQGEGREILLILIMLEKIKNLSKLRIKFLVEKKGAWYK